MSSLKGIENRRVKDARNMGFKCIKCNKIYYVTYGVYRKYKPYVPICRSCKAKSWYNNASYEVKKRHDDALRKYWESKTDDEKKQISELHKNLWKDKSDEEKIRHSKVSSINMTRYWKTISPEEFERRRHISSDILKEFRDNITPEERAHISELISKSSKRYWNNISEDELNKRKIHISEIMKYWWSHVDEESLSKRNKKLSEKSKLWWKSITEDEYKIWDERRRKGVERHLLNLQVELTHTEMRFFYLLVKNNMNFRCKDYNIYEHPDFKKLFSINPVSKYKTVSPYHAWDFSIIPAYGKKIFIDIDGSIHDKSTNGFNNGNIVAQYVEFNDSKRPYQTDGLEAYAVLCYNDEIFDNTPVINITTNETVKFVDFVEYLKTLNKNSEYGQNNIS